MFRPSFCRSAPFPHALRCSRPLVGVDTESSEVIQEIPHHLFSWPPTQSAPPTSSPNITHSGIQMYRRTIERKAVASINARKRKRDKNITNATPEKDNTTTARRIQVHATVANQLWQANQYEHAWFGLGSPLLSLLRVEYYTLGSQEPITR